MRVWFNHWFSTSYHLINMMKEKEPNRFTFVGTSTNSYAIYKEACDEFYAERHDVGDREYLDFCLEFCKEHHIDIFVPRHNIVQIIQNADEFEKIGVRLLGETNSDIVAILDDKFMTYKHIESILPDRVPDMRIAHNISEFGEFVKDLSKQHKRVCYKLSADEGARSFRVIDDEIENIRNLYNKPGNKITMEAALKTLDGYDFEIPVLVMPYLEDVEISADCLKTKMGNIVIPRYKTGKRYSEVIFDKDLMKECELLMDRLELQMPINIQFKKGGGKLYLLEINTRMSGGLQLSCKASGINIPMIALYKLIGEDAEWRYPGFYSQKVAHIETPICL